MRRFPSLPGGQWRRIVGVEETRAGLRLRLAAVEAAIESLSSDRLYHARLLGDLEELRDQLLAALGEPSEG
jgi:hypothetical protein